MTLAEKKQTRGKKKTLQNNGKTSDLAAWREKQPWQKKNKPYGFRKTLGNYWKINDFDHPVFASTCYSREGTLHDVLGSRGTTSKNY